MAEQKLRLLPLTEVEAWALGIAVTTALNAIGEAKRKDPRMFIAPIREPLESVQEKLKTKKEV